MVSAQEGKKRVCNMNKLPKTSFNNMNIGKDKIIRKT